MSCFRKLVFLSSIVLIGVSTFGQEAAAVDTIKASLAKATTAAEKVSVLDNLSRTLMNVNIQEADKYGQQMVEVAEESRDRELMVKTYISNGLRNSYFAGVKEYLKKSIDYYEKGLSLARENRLEELATDALTKLASVYLSVPDYDKASDYIGQAASTASVVENDSLQSVVLQTQGDVHLAKNAKIEALRFYLSSLRLAEKIKDHRLIRDSYVRLSNFYSKIEDHDRAIDYYTLAYKELDNMDTRNVPYQRVIDINSIGNLFAAKKSYDLAIKYHERSLAMADSLKFPNLKVPTYVSLLNHYLGRDEPELALQFLNSKQGKNLLTFLSQFGLSGAGDDAYAVIYTGIGKIDSAKYYFEKASAYYENIANEMMRANFYGHKAAMYKKSGEYNKSIDILLKAQEIAKKNGQLELLSKAAKELDTLYALSGNYELSRQYGSLHYLYKDSLDKLSREKELVQVEAQDEQERQRILAEEMAEKKRRRNNIQYLGITIGIAAFFVVLVLLGMFKVSEGMIKAIGFFVFLMLFEFIFLVFKKKIAGITHGEPLKDLFFMIGLAALLLPLHHWLEHRVIKFLTSHNRLTAAGRHIRSKLFRRSGKDEH
ncbi:MAG: hypothetical protein H6549_05660 [Chitinophagales bacterium]|nr:hypothetical protein [Chitinophagales bacterium]